MIVLKPFLFFLQVFEGTITRESDGLVRFRRGAEFYCCMESNEKQSKANVKNTNCIYIEAVSAHRAVRIPKACAKSF